MTNLSSSAPLIILDRPQMGENIGAAARAMLNFGLRGLRLVDPRDGWPNEKAGAMAAGASEVVDAARVFDDVAGAVADCSYVLATTARRRDLYLPVLEPAGAAEALARRVAAGERVAVLFGGERSGLETADIARCHGILTIPVNPEFSSLNLAQAVLLVAWEWAQTQSLAERFDSPIDALAPASQSDMDGLLTQLEAALDQAGYFFPETKREVLARNLRTALTRVSFTENEVHVLRGVIKALARAGSGRS